MPFSVSEIIEHLNLEPLPLEGGYFRQTYQTDRLIDSGKGSQRPLCTCIFFLLTPDAFSALHWLQEDEVYHFYLGDPVELFEIAEDGRLTRTVLGKDLHQGQQVQHAVFANRWQGSRLADGGNWALLGTTMAPGFTWEDFSLGNRKDLAAKFPRHQEIILHLTRETDGSGQS